MSDLIHPSQLDDTCDGIDQNCNGEIDEDWGGDSYEPNDTTAYDLGVLQNGASFINLPGYITTTDDVDSFQFYYDDDWGFGFGLEIYLENVPAQMDLVLSLTHIDRTGRSTLIAHTNEKGLGGSESVSFLEEFNSDDGGWYIISIESASGSTCTQSYRLSIYESGLY